ncbi:MAG TPA: DNA polymerase III subunit delta', partial [Mycobacteriales bacterium]|nr:DNA polymerase III subunit delta' [Mycobacteriales bacterium]
MSSFDSLVGQDRVVEQLQQALSAAQAVLRGEAGAGMTHAWLFTGPAGSGRSVAARAFAAALQCPDGGCGECHECRTVGAGSHPDVEVVTPSGLSYSVAETRRLVARSALAPSNGRWQVTVVEDADRFTEQALNALLKALEEPPPRGVWLL